MVAVLENSAGYSVERVINLALLKVNGAPMLQKTEQGAGETIVKDFFALNNRLLLDSYGWFFLEMIRNACGKSETNVSVGGDYEKQNYGTIPYKPYQNYPKEAFPVAAEELVEQFPIYYINVLVTRLARELVMSYTGNIQKRQMLQVSYVQDLDEAKIADRNYKNKCLWLLRGYDGHCFL